MLPDDFETPLQVMLMSDSYIGLDQSYAVDLNRVNAKLQKTVKEPVKKPKKVFAQIDDLKKEEEDVYAAPSKQEYLDEEAGESSDDGFCKYNQIYKLQELDYNDAQQEGEQEDSFEFDVQAEDIYDLTVF